jgi:uncharacterized repeat protein (TIGR02543 family)
MLVSMMMVGSRFISTEAFSDNKTVNITGIFDPASGQTFTDTDSLPYGANLSMDLTGTPAGQTFAFWIENGIVKPAYAVDHVFTITNNMNLQVVFTPADKVVAVFMDTNGFYLGSRYVTSGGSADTSLIALPERPGFDAVDGAGRWTMVYGSESFTNITQNSVYVQNYVDDATSNTVYIAVNNGTGTEVKNFNSIVTAVANIAPEGQKFSHWEENGVKVSAQETYQFTALYDREITAIYVPVATVLTDEVIVTLSNDVEKRPGYHTYVGQLDIPSGYEVIEYGFFIGDNADVLDETHYSHIVQGTNIHPLTSEFVSSMSIGSHMSVRAYVVVSDGETQAIVKSEVNHRYIEQTLYSFDYATGLSTSYEDPETSVNFTNLVDSQPFSTVVYRVAANTTSISGETTTRALVISPRIGDTETGISYVEYDFGSVAIDLVSFESYYWNSSAEQYFTSFWMQVWNPTSGEWVNKLDLLNSLAGTTTVQAFSNVSVDSTKVRFYATGGRNEANDARVLIDNISFVSLYKGTVHDVSFEENNGNTNNQIVADGQTVSSYTPVRTGYTFDNWYEAVDFSGSPYNFSTNVVSPLNLYAKWAINQYTLSFDSNGGSEVTAITQDFNTEVTAPSAPTKEGYSFDGWYSDSELTSLYSFTTMPAQNLTLYAKWAINQYTITFESNGGSAVTAITQDYNTAVSAPADPTKTDYTFSGWYTDNTTFENAYTFGTMPAGSITLYAKWVSAASSATVTYDSNGGSEVSSEVVTLNALATEPTDPTKTGYTFLRWTLSGVEWNFASDTVNEDITLVAVWTINEYTISFDSNGGSSVTAITQDYGTVVTEPTDPTKADYTFVGWYSDSELTSAYTFSTMPAANITLYAKWNPTVIYATDLFISEYIEGSSNNKAIEIFNGTGSSVDLSNYTIQLYSNGSTTAGTTLNLSGTLANGDVYVIANTSANSTILALADTTSGVTNFNGDDTIVLKNNGVIIDIFGQVGFDPGSAWVGTITTSPTTTTVDRTLVRNASITTGRTSTGAFDPSQEWTAYATDTSSYLGSHTFSPE